MFDPPLKDSMLHIGFIANNKNDCVITDVVLGFGEPVILDFLERLRVIEIKDDQDSLSA